MPKPPIAGNHVQGLIKHRHPTREMVNDRLDHAQVFWDFDELQQAANILVTSMLISPIVHHCMFLRIKSQMPTPRVS